MKTTFKLKSIKTSVIRINIAASIISRPLNSYVIHNRQVFEDKKTQ